MTLQKTAISVLTAVLLAATTVGVAGQDEAAEGSGLEPFSWMEGGDPEGSGPDSTDDSVPGQLVTTGVVLTGERMEATDVRATGDMATAYNDLTYGDPESPAPPFGDDETATPPELLSVRTVARRITNEDGSWTGSGYEIEYIPEGFDAGPTIAGLETLTGEGGYAGLTLILAYDGERRLGWVIPADAVPPIPELPEE
jgi:hypothetical protein